MNIFNLAMKQMQREGKLNGKGTWNELIDNAVKIRSWLDKQERLRKMNEGRRNKR